MTWNHKIVTEGLDNFVWSILKFMESMPTVPELPELSSHKEFLQVEVLTLERKIWW